MDHDETGCQSAPEGPILCIKNCGFFGSAATSNMCSKCHKDLVLKEEQAKLAQTSYENIVNRGVSSSSANVKEHSLKSPVDDLYVAPTESKQIVSLPLKSPVDDLYVAPIESKQIVSLPVMPLVEKVKVGPSRCTTCKKRVGLTGFKCRCGDLFCGSHRYSEKHDCPFDYRAAGKDEIAKNNPLVKAEKLDKI